MDVIGPSRQTVFSLKTPNTPNSVDNLMWSWILEGGNEHPQKSLDIVEQLAKRSKIGASFMHINDHPIIGEWLRLLGEIK